MPSYPLQISDTEEQLLGWDDPAFLGEAAAMESTVPAGRGGERNKVRSQYPCTRTTTTVPGSAAQPSRRQPAQRAVRRAVRRAAHQAASQDTAQTRCCQAKDAPPRPVLAAQPPVQEKGSSHLGSKSLSNSERLIGQTRAEGGKAMQ